MSTKRGETAGAGQCSIQASGDGYQRSSCEKKGRGLESGERLQGLRMAAMATGSDGTGSDDGAEELLLEEGAGMETGDGKLGAATLTGDGDDADRKC
ncbi:unnamed protein product [Linum trigynum]|uniref:Uncharacterized protein n=1 Tax=Linum trigynum TaxID=586398 RepID=A0AAV2FNS3_9ROSI